MIEINEPPRYMLSKNLASGLVAYYWSPTDKALADSGMERQKLGTNDVEARAKADGLNERLDFWKLHKRFPDEAPGDTALPGSIDKVFAVYQAINPSKPGSFGKLKKQQQKDYKRYMKRFADHKLKTGKRLGETPAKLIDGRAVDAIYEKLMFDANGKARRRVTNHVIAVCRKAFNVVMRSNPEWMPVVNPFDGIVLDQSAAETTPATYEQLLAFEAKAVELDLPELAFAARAAWDLLQRPEETCRTFAWTHWRPSEHPNEVFVRFEKRDNPVWKPLGDDRGPFYPELEERLSAVPKRGMLVMVHNRTKGRKKKDGSSYKPAYRPYTPRQAQKMAAKVRDAAELPAYVTLRSFRHGGLTELGDAGLPDTWAQAQSRHKQRATLDRYIHRSDQQQKAGARMRVAYRRGET